MQIKENHSKMEIYRPPQTCLNFFWTLTEGDDEKRVEAAIELVKMIQTVENKNEREEITTYCVNRLVRGLGSGRKFARVGFSTALTLLLRLQTELKTNQVLTCFHEKLRAERTASSKSEKAALYLGRAFAISSIIQSGRVSQLNDDMLGSLVDELLSLSNKRSFLKPVCSKALQQLITELSEKSFGDVVWPKVREQLVSAWQGCTLDRIGLLIVCKDKFPNVVNKKFIKKHWGSTLFGEENDDKLFQALQTSTEKSTAMRELLPAIVNSGRNALSIWKGLGEKLLSSGKERVLSQQQLIALEMLGNLIQLASTNEQISSLILEPTVTRAIFMENQTNNQVLGKVLNSLVYSVCEKLKSMGSNVLEFVKKILQLEGSVEDDDAKAGKLSFVHSASFSKVVSLMNKDEMEQYADLLVNFIKAKDDLDFLSESGRKRKKQLDWCFRQLQHLTCTQTYTTLAIQRNVLALFLRNGFFNGTKKNDNILHCDFIDKFVETNEVKKLCELFFFKSLNQLSTMKTEKSSKSGSFTNYTDLLSYLVHYFQSLIACDDVTMELSWSEEVEDIWKQLIKRITDIEKAKNQCNPAFRLLYLYMAFHLLTDIKTTTDLLKDIFICQDKSSNKVKKSKHEEEEEEPHWTEVLTEILMQLLSVPSHLGRVIVSHVFELMVPDVNAESVLILTQVLAPISGQSNVAFEDGEEDEEDDENGMLLDEDIPSEASSDENDGDEDDNSEDEDVKEEEDEEKIEVDEQFRASVKEVLGKAALDTEGSDEEDFSDMSDSEMFKMDEALAEVFRQRKRKFGGKKAREQKRKEMGNFRLRAMDLIDVLIKSDRCGDFLFDLLKPLLVLMFTSTREEEQAACNKAKSSFQILRSRCKGLSMSAKSKEDQLSLFQELMDLANKVTESSQLQQIASACVLLIKVCTADCMSVLQQALSDVVNKNQSKPLPSFFINLIHIEPAQFKPLCTMLVDCLRNEATKKQSKAMACTLLTSLVKASGREALESKNETDNSWIQSTAQSVSPLLLELTKDTSKGLIVKELLTLTLALLGRTDVINVAHFDSGLKDKLLEVKGKMGTDARKLSNKICAALNNLSKQTLTDGEQSGKVKKQKNKNKRKAEEEEEKEMKEEGNKEEKKSKKKKRKADVLEEEEQVSFDTDSPKPRKKKKRKMNENGE